MGIDARLEKEFPAPFQRGRAEDWRGRGAAAVGGDAGERRGRVDAAGGGAGISNTGGGGTVQVWRTSEEIMVLFEALFHEGQSILLVTHELDIAAHARRQVHLKDGRVERDFVPEAK